VAVSPIQSDIYSHVEYVVIVLARHREFAEFSNLFISEALFLRFIVKL